MSFLLDADVVSELRERRPDPHVEEWARLGVPDPLPAIDGMLAATAKVHGLTLVTRNTKDFHRTGVPLLDPFEHP